MTKSPILWQYSSVLLENQETERKKNKELWQNENQLLVEANNFAVGVIGSIISRSNQKHITSVISEHQQRSSIHAGVIQGIGALDNLIAEGLYFQAAPLVRQNLEAVEMLVELRQGDRINKKATKFFVHKRMGFGPLIGLLSGVPIFRTPSWSSFFQALLQK